GTVLLKGSFANQDERLWPGQFVNVALTLTTEQDVTVVPAQAVLTGQKGKYLFVVKPDGTVESRPVTVSRVVEGDAVVREGLQPGEQVVTDGQVRLAPGVAVAPREASVAQTGGSQPVGAAQ